MEKEEEEDNSARLRTIVGEPSEGVKGATEPGAWGLGYPSTGASTVSKTLFWRKVTERCKLSLTTNYNFLLKVSTLREEWPSAHVPGIIIIKQGAFVGDGTNTNDK